VIEHLVQVLVDLLIDLGDFFAQLAGAAAEAFGVQVFSDVLLDLPTDGRLGNHLGWDRLLGQRRRPWPCWLRRLPFG
jgi:hypothetical protein